MEQSFCDMLKEEKKLKVWVRALKDLPGSILHEHMENINRGVMKKKDKSRLIASGIISVASGVMGFFLSFLIGEGLMEVVSNEMAIFWMFICMSVFNFITCLLLARLSPNSIWFAALSINIIVWVVLVGNLRGAGGFVDLWYGWAALILFAFLGSFTGIMSLKRKYAKKQT